MGTIMDRCSWRLPINNLIWGILNACYGSSKKGSHCEKNILALTAFDSILGNVSALTYMSLSPNSMNIIPAYIYKIPNTSLF